jgi:hypothetical protein
MSKNSKNARLVREAKQRRRAVQEGNTITSRGPNGPKQTEAKHGKKRDNRSKYNRADRKGRDAGGKRDRGVDPVSQQEAA